MTAQILKLAPARLSRYAAQANAAHRNALAATGKAMGHAIEAGLALIEAKNKVGYGRWESWCEKNLEFTARHAGRYMRLARILPTLSEEDRTRVSDLSLREATKAVAGTRTVSAMGSNACDDWFSPSVVLERVTKVLGTIDLDPAWNRKSLVKARRKYTAKDDGLSKDWRGTVFLNPPHRNADKWIAKLIEGYDSGAVTEAICLLPARTDSRWFGRLDSFPRCFVRGRLPYLNGDYGGEGNPPFPSAVVYLGKRVKRFKNAFRDVGTTFVRLT